MYNSSDFLGYAMALPLQEGVDATSSITFDVSEDKLSRDLLSFSLHHYNKMGNISALKGIVPDIGDEESRRLRNSISMRKAYDWHVDTHGLQNNYAQDAKSAQGRRHYDGS